MMPLFQLRLILLVALLSLVVVAAQLGIVSVAVNRLGLDADSARWLLGLTLFGSLINLPVFSIPARHAPPRAMPRELLAVFGVPRFFRNRTTVAVNVGGCLTPVAFSLYLLRHGTLEPLAVILAVATVAMIAWRSSSVVPGVGIRMPVFVAPIAAALLASALQFDQRAALAYVAGTLGVLIGADLLRLRDVDALGARVAAIGGAGTFDGIFLTGIVAVLLT